MSSFQLTSRDSVSSWYRPGAGSAQTKDLAREAFDDAKDYLQREFQNDAKATAFLNSYTNIDDIKATVEVVKQKYERDGEKNRKTRKWIRRFSARVMYYGQVFDVLAQHHPEYVALAWGALKFVLTGVLNHATLVSQLSQALSRIGDVLPRTKLNATLYQTPYMKEAISRLYAHLILFFQQVIKWYNLGPCGRIASAIFRPFELDYKDTVEQIRFCSETVEDIANAAARAEVRDVHVELQMQQEGLICQRELQDRIYDKISEVLQVATTHKSISETIQVDVSDMKPRIIDIQFSEIMEVLKPRVLPEEALQKGVSLAKRGHSRYAQASARDVAQLLKKLESWLLEESSAIFLLRTGPRAEARAREFSLDVISFLQERQYNVLWHIFSPTNAKLTLSSVIKSLIFQALRLQRSNFSSSNANNNESVIASASALQTNHTDNEWLHLLSTILSRLPHSFLVIDLGALHPTTPQDQDNTPVEETSNTSPTQTGVLPLLQSLTAQTPNLKLLAIVPPSLSRTPRPTHTPTATASSTTSSSSHNETQTPSGPSATLPNQPPTIQITIQASTPIPPRLRRTLPRSKRGIGINLGDHDPRWKRIGVGVGAKGTARRGSGNAASAASAAAR